MHTNQTFNALTIDDISKLDLPEEVKSVTHNFDWSNLVWNSLGLPNFNATFNLVGDKLYFEKGADGQIKLHQEDFTGQCLINAIVNPQGTCENVYQLVYELTFCRGTLLNVERKECNPMSRVDYEEGFQTYLKRTRRYGMFADSWFCKWIYRPYYHLIKWTVIGISFVVTFILQCFIWLMDKITPVKLQ